MTKMAVTQHLFLVEGLIKMMAGVATATIASLTCCYYRG